MIVVTQTVDSFAALMAWVDAWRPFALRTDDVRVSMPAGGPVEVQTLVPGQSAHVRIWLEPYA